MINKNHMVFSDRGGVRTPNPQSRNLIFYPIELRSRDIDYFFFVIYYCNTLITSLTFKIILLLQYWKWFYHLLGQLTLC